MMKRYWLFLFAGLLDASVVSGQSLTPENRHAVVHVVVFESFNCTYCAKSVAMLRELDRKYHGTLAVQFRNFPSSAGAADWLPHEAALAAAGQGKFVAMYDALFASPSLHLSRAQIDAIATSLGLDMPRFRYQLDEHVWKARIADEVQEARALGVKVTPTLFVQGFRLEGLQRIETLEDLVDSALKSGSPRGNADQAIGASQ